MFALVERVRRSAQQIYDPISQASVPLLDGLVRHWLLNHHLREAEHCYDGTVVMGYTRPVSDTTALPILLIHGIGDSAMTWGPVIWLLHDRFPIYALDLPGHGFSHLPADRSYVDLQEHLEVVLAFAREQIGRPALVIGNSLGGMLAVRFAHVAPELTAGVMLLNPGGAPVGRDAWDTFFYKLRDSRRRQAYRLGRSIFKLPIVPILALAARSFQQMFQRSVILDAYKHSDDQVFLHANELRKLTVPTALVWGLGDHFLPEGSLAFFTEHLPNAQRWYLRECGHLPQRERPMAVKQFIISFAKQLTTT